MSIRTSDLKGRVAVITGASRGIGRECCLALARHGCHIVVVAKSTVETENLPGTIYSVAEEVKALGVRALPLQIDIRDEEAVSRGIDKVVQEFGRLDILINNASALWWQEIKDTPMKKFDLIVSINARGTFCMTKYCLPHMMKHQFGRIVNMSPPISLDGFKGHVAYNISKFGMTMVALGVAQEYAGQNITANSLWPATIVESQASKNFKMAEAKLWRKATILADCVLGLASEGGDFTGNMLIDDEYLTARHNFTEKDFVQYRVDPEFDPPRLLARGMANPIKRGNVRALDSDMRKSAL